MPIENEERAEVYNISALAWDGAGPTSRLLVGPESAHCRGSGGEYTMSTNRLDIDLLTNASCAALTESKGS
jgi:hypothetical protein